MSSDELASLAATWQPRIQAYFARRCRSHDDVDDLVQEAMVSIVRCYHTFQHRSTLSTWVYSVCRNVLSNHIYYRGRDSRLVQRLSLDPPTVDPDVPVVLEEALGQLPRDAKRLYGMFFVEGLSIREIATRLQRPEGTIKYLLHELRLQVRRLLES